MLLGLDGVTDRTAAEALDGAACSSARRPSAAPDEDEFYYHEIVGSRSRPLDGPSLGTIAGPSAHRPERRLGGARRRREYLIPVIADVVRAIDRPARRVVIEPLPGLLD